MSKEEMFTENDFVKVEKGDKLVFSEDDFIKPEEKIIKIELKWKGEPDLDISAIMLNANNRITERGDLVYFRSQHRWKTENPIGSKEFDPLRGQVSSLKDAKNYINEDDWRESTLPLSPDDSVIGSWDDKGEDENDGDGENCEQIHIQLNKVDLRKYNSIAIIASIATEQVKDKNGNNRFLEGDKFGDVYSPTVRIYEVADDVSRPIAEYYLNNEHPDCDGVCLGYVKYQDGLWEFTAEEKGYKGTRNGEYYRIAIMEIANSFC